MNLTSNLYVAILIIHLLCYSSDKREQHPKLDILSLKYAWADAIYNYFSALNMVVLFPKTFEIV